MIAPARRPGYFDALYAENPDPWRFETSPYEDAKYAATLEALPRSRYLSALEVGCSIGVLTRRLAGRCDALLGIDVAMTAMARAAARCADLPHVRFRASRLPDAAPDGRFDLIVLSEVLYYFDPDGLARTARALSQVCDAPTDLLLVHWLGPTPDYPLTGDQCVAVFEACLSDVGVIWSVVRRARKPDYRLDLLRIAPATR